LKNSKSTLDWSDHPGSVTVEATISPDGSLSKLELPPKGFLLHPRSPFNVGVYMAVVEAVNSAKSFWPLSNLNRDDIIVDFTIAPPL
jgi:hypothetical protein